ncbi:Cytochrome P450 [Rhynchospora pubera]|uniref:Cytochrome P450 n=2 Tax=Rhynchospora pubera TaxID=906938 RepID=A0AAV8EPR9_9POAL|nr:Cytochrome P450 [Rhynchospora pubera]
MEISLQYIGFAFLVVSLSWFIALLQKFWLRPKRFEHALRAQGLTGTPYKFPFGDVLQFIELRKMAYAKPMPLSHDIIPRVAPYFQQVMNQHGKKAFAWFEQEPTVILNDPESVWHVLTKQQNIFVKPEQDTSEKLLLPGLFAHQGEKWKKHRRIINPAFHLEKLKLMLPAFSTCCEELICKWNKLIDLKEFSELDVLPEFKAFTGDVISRTAFGSSFEEGRRIFELQEELVMLVVEASINSYIPFYKHLPTKKNKRMKDINREVEKILRDMIEQREKAMVNGQATSNDLLGILLETNIRESQEGGIKNAMTTEDVIDECKLFYIAGHETTTASLTWALVLLSMHPEWQERAREEVFNLFGGSKPDYDGLSQLKIVTMIMHEVMRLYPPVNFMERRAAAEVKLGEVTYPSGVHFLLPYIFLHRNPETWGPNANEFNPERFAQGVAKASVHGAFLPFSGGPRVCIGQNFSMLEAKLCLVRILQHFRFELSPAYAHAPYNLVTMQPQYGAQIIIRRC